MNGYFQHINNGKTVAGVFAFLDGKSCEEIVSAHSLTVFNLCCGLLCLTIPGLLIMLAIYYCCEEKNEKWKEKFHNLSIKCFVVSCTIGFFLAFFILAFIDFLYALVYIAPQVYANFGDWNETLCEREVFLTTFWLLNIGGLVVVILVAALGIYLSILYLRWITRPDKPAALRDLILKFLPTPNEPSTQPPPNNPS